MRGWWCVDARAWLGFWTVWQCVQLNKFVSSREDIACRSTVTDQGMYCFISDVVMDRR